MAGPTNRSTAPSSHLLLKATPSYTARTMSSRVVASDRL